jgi:hypothetical protein
MIKELQGIKEINKKKIITNEERPKKDNGEVDWEKYDLLRNEIPICVDHEQDIISFKMLTKTKDEGGNMNLCQVTDMIYVALHILARNNNS